MKSKLLTFMVKFFVLVAFIFSFSLVNAKGLQSYKARFAPLATSDFTLSIQNLKQLSDRTIDFDVYLLDITPSPQTFELSSAQLGIMFNTGINSTGTLTLTMNNTGSGLTATSQQFPSSQILSSLTGYPNQGIIKVSGKSAAIGSGAIISKVGYGTFCSHFTITNTVPWVSGSTPNLIFTTDLVTSPLYATRVNEVIASVATPLSIVPGTNAIVVGNPALNVTPTAYTVSGSGSYCQNGTGVPVSLSGSDVGINYQLYNGATAVGTPVAGTGSAINFGNQTAGTFTVTATNAATLLTASMTGNAVITANPIITPSVSIAASANPSTTGISITYTATPTNGGTAPTYQWYVNSVAVGTATSVNTYSYVPTNGDLVSVSMNSNATPCLVGSPVMSNTITQSVSVGTGLDQNGNVVFKVYSTNKNIFVNTYVLAKDVYVYDMLGSAIMLENNVLGVKKFDLNSYPSAYYVVKIFTADNVYSQKVLLK